MHYRIEEVEVSPRGNDVVDLPDDADILATDWRNPNRLTLAIAVPVTQCIAETTDGSRCQNSALEDEPVCGTHKD